MKAVKITMSTTQLTHLETVVNWFESRLSNKLQNLKNEDSQTNIAQDLTVPTADLPSILAEISRLRESIELLMEIKVHKQIIADLERKVEQIGESPV